MYDTDYRLILQAYDYLIDYGYLPETEEGNSVDYTQVLPSAVDHFQRMARLPRTGKWIIHKIFFFILDQTLEKVKKLNGNFFLFSLKMNVKSYKTAIAITDRPKGWKPIKDLDIEFILSNKDQLNVNDTKKMSSKQKRLSENIISP